MVEFKMGDVVVLKELPESLIGFNTRSKDESGLMLNSLWTVSGVIFIPETGEQYVSIYPNDEKMLFGIYWVSPSRLEHYESIN